MRTTNKPTRRKAITLAPFSEATMKSMSNDEKKAVAKVMTELGWGSRRLERWLGISDSTIYNATKQETPWHMQKFEDEFRETVASVKQEGLAIVLRRMLELIPQVKNLEVLIATAQYFEGIDPKKQNVNVPVQVNTTVSWVGNEPAKEVTEVTDAHNDSV